MAWRTFADTSADLRDQVIELVRPLVEPLLDRLVAWARPLDLSGPWTVNPWGPDCVYWLLNHLPKPERELYAMGFSVAESKRIQAGGFTADFVWPIMRPAWAAFDTTKAIAALNAIGAKPPRPGLTIRRVLASVMPNGEGADRNDKGGRR